MIPKAFATTGRGCPSDNCFCARCNTSGVSTRGCRFRRLPKNAWPPPARNLFRCRFMLMELMPKARTSSACVQFPLTANWAVNSRKLLRSLSACANIGRQPRK